MKLPDAMREARGGEPVTRAVALDGDDILATTPTRTLVYHGEGILSDESVEEFSHDVERLVMSEGRRKTTFTLDYVDTERSVTVPASVTSDVLDALLEGICTAAGVLDDEETVAGTFRFSELTLIVGDHQIVKHVGSTVWDQDYERFGYGELTDLAFEQLGGAMEVVLEVDGRPQRIKTPESRAHVVEETIKAAVFDFFEVQSMTDLRAFVSPGDREDDGDDTDDGLGLDSGIDPLGGVSGSSAFDDPLRKSQSEDPTGPETTQNPRDQPVDRGQAESTTNDRPQTAPPDTSDGSDHSTAADAGVEDRQPAGDPGNASADPTETDQSETDRPPANDPPSDPPVGREDVRAMIDRIEDLTEAIEKQNRLLSKQHQALKQLATEVRDGEE
ncbi:DUF7115 domain-containing protein [Halococcoides cellulosivorans]|uniref:DUF7115 domain-containing protein n=1 Tax=Halococcoides cellulosivorans TaxID=1679096 RepID=A0A2R4WZL7_9EURY|nr:hypothetical protein [Halococcoides cellulosivorans]AWB26993.1 hypothetical protein HARCEL1_04340 [Halococcoides cellulosivorans]